VEGSTKRDEVVGQAHTSIRLDVVGDMPR